MTGTIGWDNATGDLGGEVTVAAVGQASTGFWGIQPGASVNLTVAIGQARPAVTVEASGLAVAGSLIDLIGGRQADPTVPPVGWTHQLLESGRYAVVSAPDGGSTPYGPVLGRQTRVWSPAGPLVSTWDPQARSVAGSGAVPVSGGTYEWSLNLVPGDLRATESYPMLIPIYGQPRTFQPSMSGRWANASACAPCVVQQLRGSSIPISGVVIDELVVTHTNTNNQHEFAVAGTGVHGQLGPITIDDTAATAWIRPGPSGAEFGFDAAATIAGHRATVHATGVLDGPTMQVALTLDLDDRIQFVGTIDVGWAATELHVTVDGDLVLDGLALDAQATLDVVTAPTPSLSVGLDVRDPMPIGGNNTLVSVQATLDVDGLRFDAVADLHRDGNGASLAVHGTLNGVPNPPGGVNVDITADATVDWSGGQVTLEGLRVHGVVSADPALVPTEVAVEGTLAFLGNRLEFTGGLRADASGWRFALVNGPGSTTPFTYELVFERAGGTLRGSGTLGRLDFGRASLRDVAGSWQMGVSGPGVLEASLTSARLLVDDGSVLDVSFTGGVYLDGAVGDLTITLDANGTLAGGTLAASGELHLQFDRGVFQYATIDLSASAAVPVGNAGEIALHSLRLSGRLDQPLAIAADANVLGVRIGVTGTIAVDASAGTVQLDLASTPSSDIQGQLSLQISGGLTNGSGQASLTVQRLAIGQFELTNASFQFSYTGGVATITMPSGHLRVGGKLDVDLDASATVSYDTITRHLRLSLAANGSVGPFTLRSATLEVDIDTIARTGTFSASVSGRVDLGKPGALWVQNFRIDGRASTTAVDLDFGGRLGFASTDPSKSIDADVSGSLSGQLGGSWHFELAATGSKLEGSIVIDIATSPLHVTGEGTLTRLWLGGVGVSGARFSFDVTADNATFTLRQGHLSVVPWLEADLWGTASLDFESGDVRISGGALTNATFRSTGGGDPIEVSATAAAYLQSRLGESWVYVDVTASATVTVDGNQKAQLEGLRIWGTLGGTLDATMTRLRLGPTAPAAPWVVLSDVAARVQRAGSGWQFTLSSFTAEVGDRTFTGSGNANLTITRTAANGSLALTVNEQIGNRTVEFVSITLSGEFGNDTLDFGGSVRTANATFSFSGSWAQARGSNPHRFVFNGSASGGLTIAADVAYASQSDQLNGTIQLRNLSFSGVTVPVLDVTITNNNAHVVMRNLSAGPVEELSVAGDATLSVSGFSASNLSISAAGRVFGRSLQVAVSGSVAFSNGAISGTLVVNGDLALGSNQYVTLQNFNVNLGTGTFGGTLLLTPSYPSTISGSASRQADGRWRLSLSQVTGSSVGSLLGYLDVSSGVSGELTGNGLQFGPVTINSLRLVIGTSGGVTTVTLESGQLSSSVITANLSGSVALSASDVTVTVSSAWITASLWGGGSCSGYLSGTINLKRAAGQESTFDLSPSGAGCGWGPFGLDAGVRVGISRLEGGFTTSSGSGSASLTRLNVAAEIMLVHSGRYVYRDTLRADLTSQVDGSGNRRYTLSGLDVSGWITVSSGGSVIGYDLQFGSDRVTIGPTPIRAADGGIEFAGRARLTGDGTGFTLSIPQMRLASGVGRSNVLVTLRDARISGAWNSSSLALAVGVPSATLTVGSVPIPLTVYGVFGVQFTTSQVEVHLDLSIGAFTVGGTSFAGARISDLMVRYQPGSSTIQFGGAIDLGIDLRALAGATATAHVDITGGVNFDVGEVFVTGGSANASLRFDAGELTGTVSGVQGVVRLHSGEAQLTGTGNVRLQASDWGLGWQVVNGSLRVTENSFEFWDASGFGLSQASGRAAAGNLTWCAYANALGTWVGNGCTNGGISGHVLFDLNGDGITGDPINPDDPPPSIRVSAYKEPCGSSGCVWSADVLTNPDGSYRFLMVPTGTIRVVLGALPDGWVALGPTSATVNVTVGVTSFAWFDVQRRPEGSPPRFVGARDGELYLGAMNEDDPVGVFPFTVTDPDGDPVTVTLGSVFQPSSGCSQSSTPPCLEVGNATVAFRPPANFNGYAMFSLRASDGHHPPTVVTATIRVNPMPDPLIVDTHLYWSTPEDQPVSDTLSVYDPDGRPLATRISTQPAFGTATVVSGTTVRYVPAANWSGSTSFTALICASNAADPFTDPDRSCGSTIVHVTVTGVAEPPVLDVPGGRPGDVRYLGQMNEGGVATFTVNGHDPDGDAFTYAIGSYLSPQGLPVSIVSTSGTQAVLRVDLSSSGFVPGTGVQWNDFEGVAYFSLRLCDTTGRCAGELMEVRVNPVNDPPRAYYSSRSFDVNDGETLSMTRGQLLGIYDISDPEDGTNLSLAIATPPPSGQGSAWVTTSGDLRYGAPTTWSGTTSFTVRVSDTQGASTTVTVSIRVINTPDYPVIVGRTMQGELYLGSMNEGTSASFNVNVQDPDGATLTATIGSVRNPSGVPVSVSPASVSVTQTSTGTFAVTFDLRGTSFVDWYGQAYASITVSDGSLTTTATMYVNVNNVNDAPRARSASLAQGSVQEDSTSGYDMPESTLAANFTDPDGDVVSIQSVSSSVGSVSRVRSDTLWYWRFVPAANFCGTASMTVTGADPSGATASFTWNLTVTCVADYPVIVGRTTQGDLYLGSMNEGTSASFNVQVRDGDGGTLTATIGSVRNPSGVPVSVSPASVSVTQTSTGTFTVTFNLSGTSYYDWNGQAYASITVSDGSLTTTATMYVTVNPVNDPPRANSATLTQGSVQEDSTSGYDMPESTLAANFTDPDGDVVSIQSVSVSSSVGSVSRVRSDMLWYWRFVPAANFCGTASMTVTGADPSGATASFTWNLTVTCVAEYPVIVGRTTQGELYLGSMNEGTSASFNVQVRDNDGGTLTATIGSVRNPSGVPVSVSPASVSVTQTSTGTFTVTFNLSGSSFYDWNGQAYASITVSDGSLTTTATMYVTVNPVNDAPRLYQSSLSNTISEDSSITQLYSWFRGNAYDPEGATIQLTSVKLQSGSGSVTNTGTGYRFTPTANWNGTATMQVTVSDGSLSVTFPWYVTVTAVNDLMSCPANPASSSLSWPSTTVSRYFGTCTDTADGQTPTYSVQITAGLGSVSISGGTVTYRRPSDPYWGGTVTVRINIYTPSDGYVYRYWTVSVYGKP